MKKICVFLADGFEEIEGLTVVDLLRRAGIEVRTVSVTGSCKVSGAHGIDVMADQLFEEADFIDVDMLVLPGGQPGTTHLNEHGGLKMLLKEFDAQQKFIAAICAAPSVLGGLGMLRGRAAVSYPGVEEALEGAEIKYSPVARDGHIITSRGVGTAISFALELIEILENEGLAKQVSDSILYAS